MKAPFSNYLESVASGLKKLIGLLGKDYERSCDGLKRSDGKGITDK